jgi:hypothetical protein
MVSSFKESLSQISYPLATVKRGKKALICSCFKLNLFTTMINTSVDLKDIALNRGLERNYTLKAITENKVENQLMWLIKVGILRREVDGQGITDSFRLTPLGRSIINSWEQELGHIPTPTICDRLGNFWNRIINWQLG